MKKKIGRNLIMKIRYKLKLDFVFLIQRVDNT